MAVSSALLFLSIVLAPHHLEVASASGATDAVTGRTALITEFYPCALSNDEYFVISNLCGTPLDIANYSVSDGEGSLTFAAGAWLPPFGSMSVSMNSSSFADAFGRAPDVSLDVPSDVVTRTGNFRLADAGDSISFLSSSGCEVDFVRYGGTGESSPLWTGEPVPPLRQGEVAKRIRIGDTWQASGSAADWMQFREFKYGFTEFGPLRAEVPPGDLVAFTSPDCSLEAVVSALASSRASIRLCSYELSSTAVCEQLLDARARGVDVRVLVDGAPAGGMAAREVECLSVLTSQGVDVKTVNGNLSKRIVQHVGPLHSKYAVMDSSRSIVMSENFVEDGVPVDEVRGNRGWGVCVTSAMVAGYLESVFDSDARSSRHDVQPWRNDPRHSASAGLPEPPQPSHSHGTLAPMKTTSAATIELVLSPDGSAAAPFLCPLIRGSSMMAIEQFQVDLSWQCRWSTSSVMSPLLDAIDCAMGSGACVRMLFDSSWFNLERNGPAQRWLSGASGNGSFQGVFELMDPANPVSAVHNKGAVFDDRVSLVSSNNWALSSFAKNRELAALIESSEVGAYFTRAFDIDWTADTNPPRADAGPDMTVRLGGTVDLDSRGSIDDRGIAYFGWDLDGDGGYDSEEPVTRFAPVSTGRFEIRLTVEDAWGNSDTDVVTVSVLSPAGSSGDARGFWFSLAVYAVSAGSGAAVGWSLARRRSLPPGKINHQRGT